MAGSNIVFRSRGGGIVSKNLKTAFRDLVGEELDRELQKAVSTVTAEVSYVVGRALADKTFRGFTSVTGNLLEGMGVVVVRYDPKTQVGYASSVRGVMDAVGYGPAKRAALQKGERYWLSSWGSSPRNPKYHDGTPLAVGQGRKKKKRYKTYKGETEVPMDLRGYQERTRYAQEVGRETPHYKRERMRMTVFSSMPYTQFKDQKQGYGFMENIKQLLKSDVLSIMTRNLTL